MRSVLARASLWLCLAPALAVPVLAQTPSAPQGAAAPAGDSYFEFLRALLLESRNDGAGAAAALEHAAALDPTSAEIRATQATLALRRDDARTARQAADAALAIDAGNTEAHRVLGILEASQVDFGGEPSSPADPHVTSAIAHLERIADTPETATDITVQFTLGRLYKRAGQADKAIPVLQRVVNQEPDSIEARAALAEALADHNQPGDAVEVLEPAVEGMPQLFPTLGELYERAGRMREAAAAYEKAAALNPSNRQVRLRWATALLSVSGKEAGLRARDVLKPLVEGTRDARAWYLMSEAQRKAGDLPAAEAAARQVMTLDAKSPWGRYALAQVFEGRHEYQRVLDTLQPLVDGPANGGSPDRELIPPLTMLANAAQVVGTHERAIAAMTRAARIAPADEAVKAALIQTYVGARRFHEADELAAAAQQSSPGDLRFARLRARALIGLARAPEAVTALEAVRARFEARPTYWLALAEAYGEAHRISDAERTLQQAAARFPADASIPFQRGAIYEKAKRYAEAEQAFRRTIAMDGENAEAFNYLGYMLADRGERLDEAVGLISRALKLDPDNPAYLDSLGWAQFKQGDVAGAVRNLQRAAGVLVANSVVQDHFAQVLFRNGQYADAAAAWERALAGDRESIDAAAVEQRLNEARQKAGAK